ncbi:uncharacterized protein LOC114254955 isoform X1 [Monomorium pharaonis]|uniref:uncharacterized protein LOC114254955 isoform X1 n=1 Tax=Monomorium pharaonis TaxID=307658 RepID=UPI00102E12BA|nr:uncharacterized protein LOC114254955 isoform X1 [Monomorium pharaonis]
MINIVDKYFSFNRTLLLIIGLWPYEKSKLAQVQIICIFSILITGIVFQLTTILTSQCSVESIIEILSFALAFSAFVIKYNAFYVNSKTIKYLMDQVQHIYNDVIDNNEIAIVEKYGNKAKKYTVVLIGKHYFLFFLYF